MQIINTARRHSMTRRSHRGATPTQLKEKRWTLMMMLKPQQLTRSFSLVAPE